MKSSLNGPRDSRLSIHAKAYIRLEDRGFFDTPCCTFVHNSNPTCSGNTLRNVATHGTLSQAHSMYDVSPLPASGNLRSDLEHCVTDLRHLNVSSYSVHFSKLMRTELVAAREQAVYHDLQECKLQVESASGPDDTDRVSALLNLPGLMEGAPHLDVGSIVRLRPELNQHIHFLHNTKATGALLDGWVAGACVEVEAVVESVVPTRGIVSLRLPPRCISRSCMRCLDAAARGDFPATASMIHPSVQTLQPCGHQVLCEMHHGLKQEVREIGIGSTQHTCPLCNVWGFPVRSFASTMQPPHLQGEARRIGTTGTDAEESSAVDEAARGLSKQARASWLIFLGNTSWRVRFEESGTRHILMAVRRTTEALKYIADQRLLCSDARLANAIVSLSHIREHAFGSNGSLAQRDVQMLLIAAITGGDPGLLKTMFVNAAVDRKLLPGTGDMGQFCTAIRAMATVFTVTEQAHRLFPALAPSFAFHPDLMFLDDKQTVSMTDLALQATVALHTLFPGGPPLLTLPEAYESFVINSSGNEVAREARTDSFAADKNLSVKQRVAVDTQLRNAAVLLTLNQTSHRVFPGIGDEVGLSGGISSRIRALHLLCNPVLHFLDGRLNAQQQAAVQAVVSGSHGRVPYLLVGPAGCGKTAVLVECLAQLVLRAAAVCTYTAPRLLSSSSVVHPRFGRILLVAPSDEAVDLVLHAFVQRHMGNFALPISEMVHSPVYKAKHTSLTPPRDPTVASWATYAKDVALSRDLSGGLEPLPEGCPLLPAYRLQQLMKKNEWTAATASEAGALQPFAVVQPQPLAGHFGVLRLNSMQRPPDTFRGRQELLPYALSSTTKRTGIELESFVYPDATLLQGCMLVACTARVAAQLPFLGLPTGSFSHILFDEASQSLEPEALAAFELAGPFTKIVLSGDPRQLGPTIRSEEAHAFGLSVSVQERLGLGRRKTGHESAAHETLASHKSPMSPNSPLAPARLNNSSSVSLSMPGHGPAGDSTPNLHVADVCFHMAASMFKDRAESVYTMYKEELLSGDWLVRRGLPRWPTEGSAAKGSFGSLPSRTPVERPQDAFDAAFALSSTASGIASRSVANNVPEVVTTRSPLDHLVETALSINYRSHQVLCDLPSRLFYAKAPIICQAPSARTNACLPFSLLSHRGAAGPFPMLAVGVDGQMEQEGGADGHEGLTGRSDSGSAFVNRKECEAVAFLIQCLLFESEAVDHTGTRWQPPARRMLFRSNTGIVIEHPQPEGAGDGEKGVSVGKLKVTPQDIAVICPYRRQVLLMRQVLRQVGLSDVNVGEPQNLQGADKSVVFVCTVLAGARGQSLLEYYRRKRHGAPLGLLLNDKSFCVSVTRPESLLVAVGHAPTWKAEGGNWAALLWTAVEAGAFIGFGESTHCTVRVPNVGMENAERSLMGPWGAPLHEESSDARAAADSKDLLASYNVTIPASSQRSEPEPAPALVQSVSDPIPTSGLPMAAPVVPVVKAGMPLLSSSVARSLATSFAEKVLILKAQHAASMGRQAGYQVQAQGLSQNFADKVFAHQANAPIRISEKPLANRGATRPLTGLVVSGEDLERMLVGGGQGVSDGEQALAAHTQGSEPTVSAELPPPTAVALSSKERKRLALEARRGAHKRELEATGTGTGPVQATASALFALAGSAPTATGNGARIPLFPATRGPLVSDALRPEFDPVLAGTMLPCGLLGI